MNTDPKKSGEKPAEKGPLEKLKEIMPEHVRRQQEDQEKKKVESPVPPPEPEERQEPDTSGQKPPRKIPGWQWKEAEKRNRGNPKDSE